MLMTNVIRHKKEGHPLTQEEIHFFINGYVKNEIPDYQVSALLMAIYFNGLNERETIDLTGAMMNSGEVIDLSGIKGPKVDKHSTGGVGDKTSLILGPLVASCGAKVAKMSGRGLGHTGGTLDKLESIPGFKIGLNIKEFTNQVNKVGISIIGQTGDLVPADKKMYALRDVTSTVDNIGLISSSIMSKKLSTGSDSILLDVKYGKGSFNSSVVAATKLAKLMIKIGKYMGKDTRAVISGMEQPLGFAVGNNLEVIEAINTLKNKGPKDLVDLCIGAGSVMLVQARLFRTYSSAAKALRTNLENGNALKCFKEMVKAQHGDVSYIDHPDKFDKSKFVIDVKATHTGYIEKINALAIGVSSMELGAGRSKKEDPIDFTAGIVLTKKVGDRVKKGETIALLHTNHQLYDEQIKKVQKAYKYTDKKVECMPIIRKVVE